MLTGFLIYDTNKCYCLLTILLTKIGDFAMKKKFCFVLTAICLICCAFVANDKNPWGEIKKFPKVPDYSSALYGSWTLEKLLQTSLTALADEPERYGYNNLSSGEQVAIPYGLMIDVGNYGEHFMSDNDGGWEKFKVGTVYAIIQDDALLKIAYEFVRPYYKACFQNMPIVWRDVYLRAALYLKEHMDNFDYQKTAEFMKNNEKEFAYQEINGEHSPFRKLSAMLDRWIVKHKIITPERAKKWVDIIVAEVSSWKNYSPEQLARQIDSLDLVLIRTIEAARGDMFLDEYPHVAGPAFPPVLKQKYTATGVATSWNGKATAYLISESFSSKPHGADVYGTYKLFLVIGGDTFPDYTFDISRARNDTIDVALHSVKCDLYQAYFINQEIEGPGISYMKRITPGLTIEFREVSGLQCFFPPTKANISKFNDETLELINDTGRVFVFDIHGRGDIIQTALDISKSFPVAVDMRYDRGQEKMSVEIKYFTDYIGLKTIDGWFWCNKK